LVSDVDRHVVAFGCDPLDNPGAQDPLLIRFSSQESVTDWEPRATNSAGDLRIGSGSKIVVAVETRQQTIVFTDVSLHAMQYLGPPFTFGIGKISENITIQSPNAAVAIDDRVFWMGLNEFYLYEGTVNRIPCTVRDYVFNDFNFDQAEKVFATTNTEHSEVWWYYPSANSSEIDRYVVYNYLEQVWYYGTLVRTAGLDRGLSQFPLATGTGGVLYNHEFGYDDGSTTPASAIEAYVQSSPIDLGDGEQFIFHAPDDPGCRLPGFAGRRAVDRCDDPDPQLQRRQLPANHNKHGEPRHRAGSPASARPAVQYARGVGWAGGRMASRQHAV
jgi:hypothetical protein